MEPVSLLRQTILRDVTMTTDMSLVRPDPWLSERLGKNAFRLMMDDAWIASFDGPAVHQLAELLSGRVFVDAKVPTHRLDCVRSLQRMGFYLVDTHVVFEKQIDRAAAWQTECDIRPADQSDEEAVVEIARKNFRYSRFHLDPAINPTIANTIKADWTRNYFKGDRGDRMVVATVNGKAAGFLMILHTGEQMVIDLIAVDADYRQRGLASAMIASAQRDAPSELTTLKVGTQVANIPSMRVYERMGFRSSASNYVFHYHHE
jgi:ribosomal protein S18 acetylase RimI-like enzyme